MPREEWEADGIANAEDPGEPPVVSAPEEESTEEGGGEFPDAQILVDEQTGQHFLAFEIEPPEEEEGEEEK